MQLVNPLDHGKPTDALGTEAKVAYSSPVITEYGSIRALTRSKGMNGMTDGGGFFLCTILGRCRTNA